MKKRFLDGIEVQRGSGNFNALARLTAQEQNQGRS